MEDLRIKINKILASSIDNDVFKIAKFLYEEHDTPVHPLEAKRLWELYSDDYCAGFLVVDDHSLNEFVKWLNEKQVW